MLALSFLVMPSIRSAAADSAAAIEACAALLRSEVDDPGVLQCGEFLLQPLDADRRLGEFVGDRDRRHHRQTRIADLAEFGAQAADAAIELAREIHQMILLTVLAGHAELPAVDGDAHLSH